MTTDLLDNPNSVSNEGGTTAVVPIFRDSAFDAKATRTWAARMTSLAARFIPTGNRPSSKSS